MTIRTFRAGDESAQVAIYNEAAAELPRFKPATAPEVQRRTRARDFDPSMRFFAEDGGQPVAYALFNPNGRVSYPWCRKGHERWAEPLFQQVLDEMRRRGFRTAFTAYLTCLGNHGVTTGDPAQGNQALAGVDRNSPTFQAADQQCRALLPQRGPGSTTSTTS